MPPALFSGSVAPQRRSSETTPPCLGTYRASDGYALTYRHWRPGTSGARSTFVLLHGIQSHGGWYLHSCGRLAAAGHEVYLLDRRGSGLNTLDRGHAAHEDRLIHDVTQWLEHVRKHAAGQRPVILSGLSWGGKLALAVALRRSELVDGMALLYPGLVARIRPSPLQRLALQFALACGWRKARIRIPLNDPELFTDEPQWQAFIHRDELALRRVSTAFLAANLRLTAEIQRRARPLEVPQLMLLSGRDRIIDNERTRELFRRLDGGCGRLIEYAEACHTLEFEPNPDRFISDLIGWLDSVSGAVREEKISRRDAVQNAEMPGINVE